MENTELFKDFEEKVLKAKHECIKLGLEQFGIFEENYEEY